eukprot:gnl/Dysnectes_brevis/707_a780_3529.p1 GENE.gnl/Dysnectes_brevis/707_a780_3529~~gnl/Dysnectes_brevis/707_a780_3529.p1  ORF type:complete len:394 (+),score=131.03 gnl/Dysnectes_brevis/707_a780_3529:59-1240(+)
MTSRAELLEQYKEAVKRHTRISAEFKVMRETESNTIKEYEETEQSLSALHSCGQTTGELMQPVDHDTYVVKTSAGPRYLVNCREGVPEELLKPGARVALNVMTHTIMSVLPPQTDPSVFRMAAEEPNEITFKDVGGLGDEIQLVREVVELSLTTPELFRRVGLTPPKGLLLFGPPGTGKTLIAKALANTVNARFLKVVASSIVDKYIGESARVIREMFAFARSSAPCLIFLDEVDAIAGKRFSGGSSADREISRTLMQLLKELDGFNELEGVKVIMATNRPDILDPALMRPGRIDRKVEIKLPKEAGRFEILKIHATHLNMADDVDFAPVVKLSEGFNGADLRNVCTEAGMNALRADRFQVFHSDFMKAVRDQRKAKKLESSAHSYSVKGAKK